MFLHQAMVMDVDRIAQLNKDALLRERDFSNERNRGAGGSVGPAKSALLHATLSDDWKAAEAIIDENPGILRASIIPTGWTALQVALSSKQYYFVEMLLDRMQETDLATKSNEGYGTLCCAVFCGAVSTIRVVLAKNPDLRGRLPEAISVGIINGGSDVLREVFSLINFDEVDLAGKSSVFFSLISNGTYDLAMKMLESEQSLAFSKDHNHRTALHWMATKTEVMGSRNIFSRRRRILAHQLVQSLLNAVVAHERSADTLVELLAPTIDAGIQIAFAENLDDDGTRRQLLAGHAERPNALWMAAEAGNYSFIEILFHRCPELIYAQSVFGGVIKLAAMHRHKKVFDVIYEYKVLGQLRLISPDIRTAEIELHSVARLPHDDVLQKVSGAALQMQSELLWFEAVKDLTPIYFRTVHNNRGEKPQDVFNLAHEKLKEKGKEWLIETAGSCMVVATLVATVVFAAAFTVPGGRQAQTGLPINQKDKVFVVFILSDAVALSNALTSVLSFLSLKSARYRVEDFKFNLPAKLALGLLTLFMAITAMIITFITALLLVYESKLPSIPIIYLSVASLVVFWILTLHLKLFLDTFHSLLSNLLMFRRSHTIFPRRWYSHLPVWLRKIVSLW